jgi:hypothetical protein
MSHLSFLALGLKVKSLDRAMSNQREQDRSKVSRDSWRSEIGEIISGASGGFLFGIPLLYTMALTLNHQFF